MTVLLMIAMAFAFLTVDFFVQRRQRVHVAQEAAQAIGLPAGIALAANHTWLREDQHGVWTVGLDEFLTRLTGAVQDILLPRTGVSVTPAAAGVTIRDGAKRLALAIPVHGRVVEVNEAVLRNPALARKDPYGAGWLLRIRPERTSIATLKSRQGKDASEWLRTQADLARQFFVDRIPQPAYATMLDGGELADGILKTMDAELWNEFQKTFTDLRLN